MKTISHWFLSVAMILTATAMYSQGIVSGIVYEADTKQPLPGANVLIKGTNQGVSTDFDGKFSLNVKENKGTLVVSYVGFENASVPFVLSNGKAVVDIHLLSDAQSLSEVVVTGVIDVVKERQTPIAVSTIRSEVIEQKLGNLEFPEVLKTTPSIYATKQGGGYGDSRINVRGFDQKNIAVIINGQPVNDMENGRVYWSNWQGLSDIASSIQVQRGLGASKLAVPSVGGTINIITKATDKEQGGKITALFGNDNYIKSVVSYNTGINEKGWAASFLLGKWQGDGYADATQGEGYTYFTSIGYKPSDKHTFGLTFTGAAQWHNQRSSSISIEDYQNYGGKDFRKFNANWGYLNGKPYNLNTNFYNKPITSFNWDWNINDNLSVSTVVYASWGRGGGTGTRGSNFGVNPYKKTLTDAIGGLPYRDKKTGLIDMDKVVANNQATTPYQGAYPYYKGMRIGANLSLFNADGTPSGINSNVLIKRASINSHDWYGAISNLKYKLENWTLGAGIDLRTYTGYHYRVVTDLLGLDAYYSTGNENLSGPYFLEKKDRQTGIKTYTPKGGYFVSQTIKDRPFQDTGLNGDKIDYYNIGNVKWAGINGIIEYNSAIITGAFQAGISNQSYQRIDFFDQKPSDTKSKWGSFIGGYIKGGINFNINENMNVFGNAGYISRQPNFDAVFLNFTNVINPKVKNEKISSFELGYGFKSEFFNANLNGYYTQWSDRWLTRNENVGNETYTMNYEGIKELHQGIELDVNVKPYSFLSINGMISYGDWTYNGDVNSTIFDDNRNKLAESTLYVNGVKVGNSAQFTTSAGITIEPIKNLKVDGTYTHADNLYADFSLENDSSGMPNENLTRKEHRGVIKLPAYGLVDLGISYRWDLVKNQNIRFRINVNNLLDTTYIAESRTNIHSDLNQSNFKNAQEYNTYKNKGTYNGIHRMNSVWFGFGRTWNASITYHF